MIDGKGRTLLDVMLATENSMDKAEFGRIMHDVDRVYTDDEKDEALAKLEECGGYENLPEAF